MQFLNPEAFAVSYLVIWQRDLILSLPITEYVNAAE